VSACTTKTRPSAVEVAKETTAKPDARFAGKSAAPIGPFERGGGITLRFTFEDRQQRTDQPSCASIATPL